MSTAPAPETTAEAERPPKNGFDRFFEISKRGSTLGTEIRGGLVTFVTMAYIVILNPIILGGPKDVVGNVLQGQQLAAVTALTAGVMTILFGLVSRLPFSFAAGLGINSFLAVSVVGQLTWPEAMGLVLINGLIIVLLSATGLRRMIMDAIPMDLKIAITVGIGLFIAFIGTVDGGLVSASGVPSPPVGLGVGGSIATIPTLLFVLTLLLAGILMARRVKAALLIALVAGTIVAMIIEAIWHLGAKSATNPGGWSMAIPTLPSQWLSLPDLGLVGQVDIVSSWGRIGVIACVMLVFTLVFTNFFDAMGTMTGLAEEAGLSDGKGNFPRLKSALIVEGVGAVVGGGTSASSNTVFVESAAGIGEGARTGVANLVTGALFLLAMFLTPLVGIVPSEVASAALVVVGALMMSQIRRIHLDQMSVLIPVFVTIVVMPFTYSIANGIGAGFIAWAVIRSLSGKAREISPLLWIVAAGFVIYFARGPLEHIIGG
ncbi:NCS2 family permease [Microbacterium kribbense]|uniref:NCS2 family permease n=1 Tax=Microbacterium kribbense TaxID=433645 RepID=A0ABP7GG71_9MICO